MSGYTRRALLAGLGGAASALPVASAARSWAAELATPAAALASNAAAAGVLRVGDQQVNRLGFGAMRITGPGIWGEPADPAQARAVLRRAIKLGVNFIDTADACGPGVSEQLIYQALHPYPSNLLIATKGGNTRPSADQWVARRHSTTSTRCL